MKTITTLSLAFVLSGALVLGTSTAYASEVTGQLSSSDSSGSSIGSHVSGTFGGGNSSAASSGTSGGGGGGGGGSGFISGSVSGGVSGGGGNSSIAIGPGVVAPQTGPAGAVLGASTEVSYGASLTDDSGSFESQNQSLALGDVAGATTHKDVPLVAAVVTSGIGAGLWWLWIVLLLAAIGVYTYWRSQERHQKK